MVAYRKTGFSLLELLVAMAIFVMIVLMMSTVFHQSSVAWDSGTRKAQNGMTARAVLGFMARELMEAAEDTAGSATASDPPLRFTYTGTTVTFNKLSNEPTSTERSALRIHYECTGGEILRKEDVYLAASVYEGATGWQEGSEVALADGVSTLNFIWPGDWSPGPGANALPPWVTIRIELTTFDDVSTVGAESAGPDRNFANAGDNITSF
jgi:prepilin-type N-terminal cleavage/methylation domain-containing protein